MYAFGSAIDTVSQLFSAVKKIARDDGGLKYTLDRADDPLLEYDPIKLKIDSATGDVLDHEGRHRMLALQREGIKRVPVLLFDFKNKNSKQGGKQANSSSPARIPTKNPR